jgi:hypothetical protein
VRCPIELHAMTLRGEPLMVITRTDRESLAM